MKPEKPEMIICPFCGGVYREPISLGTAQVKCKYCGGTVLVPPHFGGEIWRCPNHPDVFAVGLCNDCGGRYCDSCLYFYSLEQGTLHLCPDCFKARKSREASGILWIGVLFVFFGFIFAAAGRNAEESLAMGAVFLGFFAVPTFAWGFYKRSHIPKGLSVRENRESIEREKKIQQSLAGHSTYELYNMLVGDYIHALGPRAFYALEREIDVYMDMGLSRSEAIRKLAARKGYVEQENG